MCWERRQTRVQDVDTIRLSLRSDYSWRKTWKQFLIQVKCDIDKKLQAITAIGHASKRLGIVCDDQEPAKAGGLDLESVAQEVAR